jgi:ubiquinone/menaquinone biosynthesis C-methylase UbiE
LQTQHTDPAAASPADRASHLLRYEADIAFRRRARTLVEYLDPRSGDLILDAGCGLGFQLTLLDQISEARLVGVELDRQRLMTAHDDLGPRVVLLLGDVTRLPFERDSFDKMILSEVLEHLPEDRAALSEALRILKPGGILAITVPNKHYPFLWDPPNYLRERLSLGHFTKEPLSGIWTDHRRLYARDELSSLVRATGFEVDDVHLETRYSMPFAHHMVYGLGKLLVERNLVGGSNRREARRSTFWRQDEEKPTPLQRLVSVFTAIDQYNRPRYESGPAVSLCLKAIKPR